MSKPLRINIGLKFPYLTVTQHSSPAEVLCQCFLEHCLCDQHSLLSLTLFTLAKTNQAAFPEDLWNRYSLLYLFSSPQRTNCCVLWPLAIRYWFKATSRPLSYFVPQLRSFNLYFTPFCPTLLLSVLSLRVLLHWRYISSFQVLSLTCS